MGNPSRTHHQTFIARFAALALGALTLTSVGCAATEEPTDEGEQTEAFTSFPSDFPDDSGWARAMIKRACGLAPGSLDAAEGSITRTSDGVVYKATVSNRVVASA